MNNYINIKTEVLKEIRESLNLDYENASELSKISLQSIKDIESGRKPNLEELTALSKAYKKSLATLLLHKLPESKPLPKDRRTINSEQIGVFDIKTIRVVEKARVLGDSYIRLRNELNLSIPKFTFSASLADDPNEKAKLFRKIWKLDKLSTELKIEVALDSFIEIVETLGIFVFQLSLTKDNLRGFSLIDEEYPIVVIKRGNEQPTAKIFTLFHEIGHLLLNESGLCDWGLNNQQPIEKWCNGFASEILVPSEKLLMNEVVVDYAQHGNKVWERKDLVKIAEEFYVGPLVILRKLLEHKLTTKQFYEEKLAVWNKPTFGRSKEPKGREIPKKLVKERGKTFIGLAFTAYEQNRINLKELSDYLGAKLNYIPKIRQHLYGY